MLAEDRRLVMSRRAPFEMNVAFNPCNLRVINVADIEIISYPENMTI